jgi:hypothetical protein
MPRMITQRLRPGDARPASSASCGGSVFRSFWARLLMQGELDFVHRLRRRTAGGFWRAGPCSLKRRSGCAARRKMICHAACDAAGVIALRLSEDAGLLTLELRNFISMSEIVAQLAETKRAPTLSTEYRGSSLDAIRQIAASADPKWRSCPVFMPSARRSAIPAFRVRRLARRRTLIHPVLLVHAQFFAGARPGFE